MQIHSQLIDSLHVHFENKPLASLQSQFRGNWCKNKRCVKLNASGDALKRWITFPTTAVQKLTSNPFNGRVFRRVYTIRFVKRPELLSKYKGICPLRAKLLQPAALSFIAPSGICSISAPTPCTISFRE